MADGIPSLDGPGFLSREPESAALESLLRDARAGRGGALVLRGDAGIGKTVLLERAVAAVPGLRRLRTRGIGVGALPYGALHELCEPVLAAAEALPGPQREAVEVVFGLRDGPAPEPSHLGLAVRTLLASGRPAVCLVDDAHALDPASARVLAFAARRARTAPVAFLLAGRDEPGLRHLAGLPEHRLDGLRRGDALALFGSRLRSPLDARVRDRLIAETRGNPGTVLEAQRQAGTDPTGGYGPPAGPPDDLGLRTLSADTRRLLLLAAAEPLGDPALLWDAAARLGIATDAAAPAEEAGLLRLGARVLFAHPGLRSSVYAAAAPADRRAAHAALAEATARPDPDRRAWHRARSTIAPDEAVAAALELAVPRARARGGLAAAGAFLGRAAALTPDPARRAARALAAARLALGAGAAEAASGLLATAAAGPLDERGRALAALLSARLALHDGRCGDAVAPLLDAARGLAQHDRPAAGEARLDALAAGLAAGRLGAHHRARAARAAIGGEPGHRPAGLLLDAVGRQLTSGQAAAPALRAAVDALLALPDGPDHPSVWLACGAAADLWDDGAWRTLAERQLDAAHRTGARGVLPLALRQLALARVHAGEFDGAAALVAEVRATTGPWNVTAPLWADLMLTAWRGDGGHFDRLADAATRVARDRGHGQLLSVLDHAASVLHNGAGRYETALHSARRASQHDDPGLRAFVPSEVVEAAVRAGRPELAGPAMDLLTERTRAAGTDWADGIGLRSQALLATGPGAEDLFLAAIHALERTRAVPQLARTRLLYGEWLRREARRGDARTQLRRAHETLASIGAAGFAARAARELAACGERPAKPGATPLERLTPQETRIALLVADGATSKEAARELFLSPRTVDAHLRSIFKKLGLTSRRQLRTLKPGLPANKARSG
ncbi:helix-turn-helix transcriptional regulator [Actinomadura darangshiensis]|uniref:Helix-turn-helix transcriptional regulator n=1 Tax=Actinomadura darangshiensis TaxID=705336 RepID=A0A4R5B8P1_9ACTN|nr:LuxR family transcriptional regulator [Actinomadura darangshiensis]TDD81473.1 helix-turn-helix transcriptional regulator [Actinomadura darangshiensis]